MKWTEIKYGDDTVHAANFLNGILLELHELHQYATTSPLLIFIPGWQVQPKRGDMDGPGLHQINEPPPTYRLELVSRPYWKRD